MKRLWIIKKLKDFFIDPELDGLSEIKEESLKQSKGLLISAVNPDIFEFLLKPSFINGKCKGFIQANQMKNNSQQKYSSHNGTIINDIPTYIGANIKSYGHRCLTTMFFLKKIMKILFY